MNPLHDEKGRALYLAIKAAVAGGPMPVAQLARLVGCTPREALEVLLRFDRASLITIAPATDEEDLVVRPSRPPG